MFKFDVYVLQDDVSVCIGKAENLADAEQLIKSQLITPVLCEIVYERTPDGLIVCRSLKHGGDGVHRSTEPPCTRQKLLRLRNLWATRLKTKFHILLRKAAPSLSAMRGFR